MGKTALVEGDIRVGEGLIEALDAAGFPVQAALWFYLSDPGEWRLIVASPLTDKDGPRGAYEQVQSVLTKLRPPLDISLSDISVVGSKDELIKLLRQAIGTGSGISGIRFTRNTINGVFIEDAYIYRLASTVHS